MQLLQTGRPRLERNTVPFLALRGSNITSASGFGSPTAAAARVDWAVKAEAVTTLTAADGST